MQNAETVLAIYRDRGRRRLPLDGIYRMLFNRDLYLLAYAKLYPNQGAMTKGTTTETVDGMSIAKIDRLIDEVRHQRFRWTPVRRVHIPKSNGKTRPLGVTSWRDKLLQEVIRSLLEAYYEPQFSAHAHGFRPGRGCHTALSEIQQTWTGTAWFVEGDLAQYFDTINHTILLKILGEDIHDNRFLRLLRELLQAGYLEDWTYHPTLSGTPQGAVLSPVLSNIYLARFDQYIETELIPAYTRGARRAPNPAYVALTHQIAAGKRRGDKTGVAALRKQRRLLPSVDLDDSSYRRLRYARYADDFVLGFVGTRQEAEEIKRTIKEWLWEHLNLSLSDEKTLITSAINGEARFLGYAITNQYANDKVTPATGRRNINGRIALRVPHDVIVNQCHRYMRHGKASHRRELVDDDDFSIIARYQQEYRGIVQYYLLATNVCHLGRLEWVMKTSLLKTLANKHKTSVGKMSQKYEATISTPEGTRKVLECRVKREGKPDRVARFGGIARKRQPTAVINDQPWMVFSKRVELLKRLEADECELCGSTDDVEVHHIRKLADLTKKGRKAKPRWVEVMVARRRKTLVVCRSCHEAIHAGRPTRQRKSE